MLKVIVPTKDNIEDIVKLHKKVFEHKTNTGFIVYKSKSDFEDILKDKVSLAIYFEDKLVAYSLFQKIENNTIRGKGAIVDFDFRGLGLQLLMYRLIKKTTTQNMLIIVNKENVCSIKNILKLGLKLEKEKYKKEINVVWQFYRLDR